MAVDFIWTFLNVLAAVIASGVILAALAYALFGEDTDG